MNDVNTQINEQERLKAWVEALFEAWEGAESQVDQEFALSNEMPAIYAARKKIRDAYESGEMPPEDFG